MSRSLICLDETPGEIECASDYGYSFSFRASMATNLLDALCSRLGFLRRVDPKEDCVSVPAVARHEEGLRSRVLGQCAFEVVRHRDMAGRVIGRRPPSIADVQQPFRSLLITTPQWPYVWPGSGTKRTSDASPIAIGRTSKPNQRWVVGG